MNTNTCKNYEKCPIYTGILKDNQVTSKSYREQYCNAGPNGWNKCKRYLIKEKTGQCPPNLLPNSLKSVEEIITSMQLSQK